MQTWFNFAFQFPDHCNNIERKVLVKASDPGMLRLFVRFYWALSQSEDYNSAAAVLQKELRRRGFGYVLHPTQPAKWLGSTADITKLKIHPTQTQIRDDAIDAKTEARVSQREDTTDKVDLNGALCGQSPPKKAGIPPGLNFRKNPTPKKDVPGCSEQEEKSFSQTCPPSLDPTSLSVTRDPCHIELNSSTLPLPPESQNRTTVCDLVKTGKRRQTSPDSRCVKHRKFNEATWNTSKLCNVSDASINTRPVADTQKPLLCANPPIWAQVRDNTLRDTTNLAQYSFRPEY